MIECKLNFHSVYPNVQKDFNTKFFQTVFQTQNFPLLQYSILIHTSHVPVVSGFTTVALQQCKSTGQNY